MAKLGYAIGALVLSSAVLMAANTPATNTASASKVTICHFNGHAGDFVTINSNTNPAGQPACDAFGGNAITVSASGCNNGHGAVPYPLPYGGHKPTCDEGDQQTDGAPPTN